MLRRFFTILLLLVPIGITHPAFPQDYARARRNQQEAEYYMKKAEANRREASDLQRKAENYQREATYCTRQGKLTEAKSYSRKAEQALTDKQTLLRQAKQNDDRAAQYFRSAARALE